MLNNGDLLASVVSQSLESKNFKSKTHTHTQQNTIKTQKCNMAV